MQMLVAVIHAVAREMLGAGGKSETLQLLDIKRTKAPDALDIRTAGAHVGDGIAEVHVDVADGGEGPVHAASAALAGTDLGKTDHVGVLPTGGNGHRPAEEGAVGGSAASAFLQVGGFEQREFCRRVQRLVPPEDRFRRRGAEQDPANRAIPNQSQPLGLVIVLPHDAEELSGFFLQRHGVHSLFDLLLLLCREKEGGGRQIDPASEPRDRNQLAQPGKVPIPSPGRRGVAHAGGLHPGAVRRLGPRQRVLDHKTVFAGKPQPFGGLDKDLGIRLGMGDVIAVGDRVEAIRDAEPLENKGGVLARRTDGELQSRPTQTFERFDCAGKQIRGRQVL